MVCHADQVPAVRVRAATSIAARGRVTPRPQLTPTSPKPVTDWGVVVSVLAPPRRATMRASEVDLADRPAVVTGEVSWTSRTDGVTGVVGTVDARTASAVYAAVRRVGCDRTVEPPGPTGADPTTSRVTRLAAGVSTASTTARASSC